MFLLVAKTIRYTANSKFKTEIKTTFLKETEGFQNREMPKRKANKPKKAARKTNDILSPGVLKGVL
jgi:hypothetical protein